MAQAEHNPYSAPEAELAAPQAPHELRLAGRGLRLGAALIDWLIGMLVAFPFLYLIGYAWFEGSNLRWSATTWRMSLQAEAIAFVVFALVQGLPLARAGQTWGKQVLGLRIVDLQGNKPSFVRLLLLRYGVVRAIGLVPWFGPFYRLLDVLFIFSADRRCLHDLIAETRVVVAD